MEVISLSFMEEKELKSILGENIKKFRNKRGWNQLLLSEKIGISANYLSVVETGKGWVTPLTLVKLAKVLDIDVYELFLPEIPAFYEHNKSDNEKIKRFARDMALALENSASDANNGFKKTIAKVCKEYLDS